GELCFWFTDSSIQGGRDQRSEGAARFHTHLRTGYGLASIDRLSLLESFAPVAIEVVRLAVNQIVLSIRERSAAGAASEAARMPMTVESQQTSVHQSVVATCTLGVELGSKTDDTVGKVVGNLVGLLDGSLAAVAAEMVGMPETIDGHHSFVPHRRVAQRAQTTVRIISWLGHGWRRVGDRSERVKGKGVGRGM
ncbi:hypothetical protein PMAYCL1PPCAC_05450, partial [Pristionchus mayeri]